MKRIVAPSILSADFGNLERDIKMIDRSAAEWVHIDVMDGLFVPNISFGFPVMKPVRRATAKVLDVHLMIVEPEKYVKRFVEAGADYVTFHHEACANPRAAIADIKAAGAKAGVSVKPATPVEAIFDYLSELDMVLIMSVEPGFGGQSFMPHSLDKVRALRKEIEEKGYNCLIEIDGGISAKNAREVFDAGVDVIVAGSSVFGAEDQEQAILNILNA
ncbi:MAG: ribulose-phosphate 3-epimerase [Rikenellaceae bacterium]|nr:ribulose-phosphate 3-epimerase [Rikenellaceae bacterium]